MARASLSFDPNLARDSLTGSYFLFPVPKLGPENVTASLVPGCSTRAAELWLASILLSRCKSRASVDSTYVDVES